MRASRLLLLAILLSGTALAQNFLLDIPDQGNVPLPDNGMIPVHVIYTANDNAVKSVEVLATQFASDQQSVPVDILKSCDAKASAENQPTSFALQAGHVASFCLRPQSVSTDGKYAGSLNLFPDNNKAESAKKFSFTRTTPPATLATDHQSATIDLVRPFWAVFSTFDSPAASATLQEKTGKGTANCVAVQVDAVKAPGAFDPLTNLGFEWNGQAWDQPFSSCPQGTAAGEYIIKPGQQAAIAVNGKNFESGEYTIPLHFSSLGANVDNAKLSVTVHVRSSIWWALIWLGVGLLGSFVVNKILTGKRRKIDLLRQIRDLRASNGVALPKVPAVVWVDAVLHLAERLSCGFWLTGADIIQDHVNSVRSTVAILRLAQQVQSSLQQNQTLDKLILDLAAESMGGILTELGTGAPDDAQATRIKAELTAFNDWLQASTYPAALFKAFQPRMERLQRDINSGAMSDAVKAAIKGYKDILDRDLATPPTASRQQAEDSYRNYARLYILWDCRANPDVFDKLTIVPPPDLQEVFRINDELTWQQLTASRESLKVQMPTTSSPDGLETFAPLSFSVTTDDPIGSSFLFRRKVQYDWKFTLTPAKARQKTVTLAPTTIGPLVAQYFPSPGKVEVSVSLSYTGTPITLTPSAQQPAPDIVKSSDFGFLRAYEGMEWVSLLIAAGVAIVTGLSTYYFKNPTFGSPQDYITLLLWGIGMDQGKNFLQALQQVSGQSASTPTPPATPATPATP